MPPSVQRPMPQHLQVAGELKRQIISGELAPGARLPTVDALERRFRVSHKVAQRAIEYLRTEGLVITRPGRGGGTYAAPGRVTYGPNQRRRATTLPAAGRIEFTFAGAVTAPRYIWPVLGQQDVIRREWVAYQWTPEQEYLPVMLASSWCPAWAAAQVPELLAAGPLPGPGSAAELIAARTGRVLDWSKDAYVARPVKDDGREAPLLHLPAGTVILGRVSQWAAGEDVIEYLEAVLPQHMVIESDVQL